MDEEDAETYEKYADELIRFATALTGPSMAEDVLSDAMLRVFSSPPWKAVRNRRAYLYRAVLNEARQARRSIDRRLRREQAGAGRPASEGFVDRFELLDALRRLSMRQRA